MKFRQRTPRQDRETLIPLINVVFLLLIFFMLAGRLTQQPPFDWTPPDSRSDRAPGDSVVVVHVAPEGRIAVAGREVALDGLRNAVRAAVADRPGPVHLRADRDVEANHVIGVLERLRAAGLESVRLYTKPGET
jgi:biopolymer transport protein ExbD